MNNDDSVRIKSTYMLYICMSDGYHLLTGDRLHLNVINKSKAMSISLIKYSQNFGQLFSAVFLFSLTFSLSYFPSIYVYINMLVHHLPSCLNTENLRPFRCCAVNPIVEI